MSIDLKIQAWIEAEMEASGARDRANRLLREAEDYAVPPESFRPAVEDDIRPGAIIWYHLGEDKTRQHWQRVLKVNYPGDQFKAYTAWDGCRYGLAHAFVETEKP